MTSRSVRGYTTGIYRKLGLKEEEVRKVQTGGPDGDLGSSTSRLIAPFSHYWLTEALVPKQTRSCFRRTRLSRVGCGAQSARQNCALTTKMLCSH